MAVDPKKLEKLVTTLQAEVTSLKRRCNALEAERVTAPSTERFLWELRYRGSMSVDNVLIETLTKQEEEANALGQWYLDSLATPSVRFVRARRIVVARTVDVPSLLQGWQGQPVEIAQPEVDEDMAPAAAAVETGKRIVDATATALTGTASTINAPKSAMKVAEPARHSKGVMRTPPPKGTDPPPTPEGPRHQTHDTDPRAAARQLVMGATRSGKVARLGD